MRIIYPYPEDLPSRNARSVQALNTVCALGECVEVHFFPAGIKGDIFGFYGLRKPRGLVVEEVRRRWGPFTWTGRYAGKIRNRAGILSRGNLPVVIYTRHIKIAHLLAKSRPGNAAVVYEVHEIFSEKKPGIAGLESYVFEHADGLVFISRGLEEAITKGFGNKTPHCVVPSGVAIRHDHRIKDDEKPWKEVFYVGSSRYEWKGIEVLLEAVARLEGIKLNIIGDLESRITQLHTFRLLEKKGRINVWGYIPPASVPRVLQEAAIGVLPTSDDRLIGRKFTSPLKLLEYMAAGMAVVASDLPSTREIVSEKEALLVAPGDPVALASGIERIVSDPELRSRLARNAFKKAGAFSWEKRAEKILAFLNELFMKRL